MCRVCVVCRVCRVCVGCVRCTGGWWVEDMDCVVDGRKKGGGEMQSPSQAA